MKSSRKSLVALGAAYGALWGLVAAAAIAFVVGIPPKGSGLSSLLGNPLAEILFLAVVIGSGVPMGIVCTRVCAPWLRKGSAWRLLWVAPSSLLMGTVLLGLQHAALAECYGWLALGKSLSGGGGHLLLVYPLWYALGAFFILFIPVPLAFLNCWHLRKALQS